MYLRRFVWWKCIFWFVLGAGVGAAACALLPEPGPGGATRISAEEFVSLFQYPAMSDGSRVTAITILPTHDGVDLLRCELVGKRSRTVYVYGQRPFVRSAAMGQYEMSFASKQAESNHTMYSLALLSLRAKRNSSGNPGFQDWASAGAFVDAMKLTHSQMVVTRDWWAESSARELILIGLGSVVIGTTCSLLLARRTPQEQAAHEMMRTAAVAPPLPAGPSGPTPEEIRRLQELDEALARNLGATNAPSDPAGAENPERTEIAPQPVIELDNAPLEAPAEIAKEEKDYSGVYYPTVRRVKPNAGPTAFTLVEILVVIGILAVIIGMLLPTLARARQSADSIACAANLHSIGQGFVMYLQTSRNTFPAAYTYIGQTIGGGPQVQTGPGSGYIHWSSYLFGTGAVPQSAFTCPSMERGGLPPTNTPPENRNGGQQCPSDAIVDQQTPRLAYTVNEAICPRNKFQTGFQLARRVYRFVKANEVRDASQTILATEMVDSGNMVSYGEGDSGYIMSHRPIQGFCNDTSPDIFLLPIDAGFRKATAADIDPDPLSESLSNSRLDLVGRNHGPKRGYPDHRLSNFAYVDGHVETKSVYDTVQPFQWGETFYSLVPNDDLKP